MYVFIMVLFMDKVRNGKMVVNFCVNVLICILEDIDVKKGVYMDWDVYVLGKFMI